MFADWKGVFVFQVETNIGGLSEAKQQSFVDCGKVDFSVGNQLFPVEEAALEFSGRRPSFDNRRQVNGGIRGKLVSRIDGFHLFAQFLCEDDLFEFNGGR